MPQTFISTPGTIAHGRTTQIRITSSRQRRTSRRPTLEGNMSRSTLPGLLPLVRTLKGISPVFQRARRSVPTRDSVQAGQGSFRRRHDQPR